MGDLESFLGDLEAILGRSWGLLVCSWRLLARSWAVLEGQEGQKSSEPESLADHGRELLPPPSEIRTLGPHPLAHFQLEKEDGTTGKREKYHKGH